VLCYHDSPRIPHRVASSGCSLDQNWIGLEAGKAIAEALKVNQTITNVW
jgi:hypothetical protein